MSKPVIRVGGYAPVDSVHSRAVDHFARFVTEAAGDEVEVDVLYNVMDLDRPASDLLDMVTAGELTWCYFSTSYLGSSVPELEALEIPFFFDSLEQAHNALDGELGDSLSSATKRERGYEVLGYWDNGFRHLTNRVRPIRTPDDCAGLSIRLQPNKVHEALAQSWGMVAVPAELSQGIALIRNGEVDAQENPLANSAAYGVDHQHITLSAHLYGARGLYANAGHMESLGPELADVVRSGARAAIEYQRKAAVAYEGELRARFEAEGRTVVDLSVAERQAFVDAAAAVTAKARAAVGLD